jgi:hypothetical protein
VIEVLPVTVTPVAAVPSKLTVVPDTKFVPMIVATLPPPIGPVLGLIPVAVGGAT